MEITIKHFTELTTEELLEIIKLRIAVFVVEQNCPYQDVDDIDKVSYHVCFREDGELKAYLRVLGPGVKFAEASVGRVISMQRRTGLGSRLLAEGIRVAEEKFAATAIRIEAQTYARSFYEKAGFVQVSDEFLEDGIPHIQMLRRAENVK